MTPNDAVDLEPPGLEAAEQKVKPGAARIVGHRLGLGERDDVVRRAVGVYVAHHGDPSIADKDIGIARRDRFMRRPCHGGACEREVAPEDEVRNMRRSSPDQNLVLGRSWPDILGGRGVASLFRNRHSTRLPGCRQEHRGERLVLLRRSPVPFPGPETRGGTPDESRFAEVEEAKARPVGAVDL